MDNKEIIAQLAQRMGSNEEVAALWLEAALDILHRQVLDDSFELGAEPLPEPNIATEIPDSPSSFNTINKPDSPEVPSVNEQQATAELASAAILQDAIYANSSLAADEEIDDSAYAMAAFASPPLAEELHDEEITPLASGDRARDSFYQGRQSLDALGEDTHVSRVADEVAASMPPATTTTAPEIDEQAHDLAPHFAAEMEDHTTAESPEAAPQIGEGLYQEGALSSVAAAAQGEAEDELETATPAPPPQLQSLPTHFQGRPILRSGTTTTTLSVDEDVINLDNFPFRVGRETRAHALEAIPGLIERRGDAMRTTNDLYVRDMTRPLNVSREHFLIQKGAAGGFELVDRGSACGTIVGDRMVGGNYAGGSCPLKYGDAIKVGTPESSIVFEFVQQ